jgi:hypothetical protein
MQEEVYSVVIADVKIHSFDPPSMGGLHALFFFRLTQGFAEPSADKGRFMPAVVGSSIMAWRRR